MAVVIVTLMLIPQSLAYTLLAGLSPEMRLYASIRPNGLAFSRGRVKLGRGWCVEAIQCVQEARVLATAPIEADAAQSVFELL